MAISSAALLANSLLAVSLVVVNRQTEHHSLAGRQTIDGEYDFIVVGAGSAGSVVAARLSEHSQFTVLVIEAGGPESVVSDMPAMAKQLWGSEMDWNYEMTPQRNAFRGYNRQTGSLSLGKAMGGSSTINAMAYARGFVGDYERWTDYGVRDWSWSTLLPFFMRSENNTDSSMNGTFHGRDGPLAVSSAIDSDLLLDTALLSAQQLGYSVVDLNDPNESDGVAIQQMTVERGSRCSAAKAFLSPARLRPNLHIWANALVTRVNFNSARRAESVIVDKAGVERLIRARRAIILSAGAVNTAKLLMLSGVGPRKHLQELDIAVVADLPVGLNYHDNPVVFGVHFFTNATKPSEQLLEQHVSEFFLAGDGPLTRAYKPVLRFTTNASAGGDPDAQIFVSRGSFADFANGEAAERATNLKAEVWNQFYGPYSGRSTLTITPLLNRPASRGSIRLRSSNANDAPVIEPNLFGDVNDLKVMVEAMKMAYRFGQTDAFERAFRAEPFRSLLPACPEPQWPSVRPFIPDDDYLECAVKTLTGTYSHAAGTCRMGDRDSVVSSELKVHGVDGLRVVDASVVPQSPSGALHATAIMIGERGAQFILRDSNVAAFDGGSVALFVICFLFILNELYIL